MKMPPTVSFPKPHHHHAILGLLFILIGATGAIGFGMLLGFSAMPA